MHSRACPECIVTHDGIICGKRHPDRCRRKLAILTQGRHVVGVSPKQVKVDDQEVHLRVAHPLAHAKGCGVYAIHAGFDCSQAVDHSQAAISVSMPVEFDIFARRYDDLLLDEFHQIANTGWRRVTHRVCQTKSPGPPTNRIAVQRLQRFRPRTRRVFGDVHDGKAFANGEGYSLFTDLQHAIERPVFGVLAYGRRTDERGGFDGYPGFLGNFRYGLHIGDHRPGGAVGSDREVVLHYLLRQHSHRLHSSGARAGQTNVRSHDPHVRHEVQEPALRFGGGIYR